jgi:hypothetical protein
MKTKITSANATTAIAAATLALGLTAPTQGALIGQWTFNEGSGTTAFDSSANSNHGTLTGGATYISTGADNFGLLINGSGQHVEVPASPLWNPQAGALSVIAWVTTSNGIGGPIGNEKQIVGIPSRVWSLGVTKSEERFMMIGDLTSSNPGTALIGSADNSMTDGVQYMTGFAKDAAGNNQLRFWLNGVMVAESGGTGAFEDTATAGTSATPVVQIGMCCGGNILEGVIDEIRIYDHQLSQAEIDAMYAAGPAGIPTIEITQMTFPNTMSVCVTGEFGNIYTLQSTSAADGPYADLGLPIPGNGANLYFFDTSTAASDTKFYRIQTQP